jgi:anti-anti-sigma regulatory factor
MVDRRSRSTPAAGSRASSIDCERLREGAEGMPVDALEHALREPRVELRELSEQTTVVAAVGDQDLSVKRRLLEQLERARTAPTLIIDLTHCTFVDSTIIATLQAQRPAGPKHRVEVVLPASGSNAGRALQLVALSDQLPTHRTLEDALASVERGA